MVREFVISLEDRGADDRTAVRMRHYLEALGRPDIRYLVGTIRGAGAEMIGRYARAVLEAAAAPAAASSDALDDPLLGRAGTRVAEAAYGMAATHPELGELSRDEARTLVALTAAAEASRRVLLLVDERGDAPALAAVGADLIVLARMDEEKLAASMRAAPGRTPIVVAPTDAGVPASVVRLATQHALVGGRDFTVSAGDGPVMTLSVGGESYASLALGAGDDAGLAATGIVAALGLGALGIRMRPEWIERGARRAAGRE